MQVVGTKKAKEVKWVIFNFSSSSFFSSPDTGHFHS